MDIYHVWCDLKQSGRDLEFRADLDRYLDQLRDDGLIGRYRVTRRKLGLGPKELGEFHIQMEVRDLAQLDDAFRYIVAGRNEIGPLHEAVYSSVKNLTFALYRDFPDALHEGSEGLPQDLV